VQCFVSIVVIGVTSFLVLYSSLSHHLDWLGLNPTYDENTYGKEIAIIRYLAYGQLFYSWMQASNKNESAVYNRFQNRVKQDPLIKDTIFNLVKSYILQFFF